MGASSFEPDLPGRQARMLALSYCAHEKLCLSAVYKQVVRYNSRMNFIVHKGEKNICYMPFSHINDKKYKGSMSFCRIYGW